MSEGLETCNTAPHFQASLGSGGGGEFTREVEGGRGEGGLQAPTAGRTEDDGGALSRPARVSVFVPVDVGERFLSKMFEEVAFCSRASSPGPGEGDLQ